MAVANFYGICRVELILQVIYMGVASYAPSTALEAGKQIRVEFLKSYQTKHYSQDKDTYPNIFWSKLIQKRYFLRTTYAYIQRFFARRGWGGVSERYLSLAGGKGGGVPSMSGPPTPFQTSIYVIQILHRVIFFLLKPYHRQHATLYFCIN